MDKNEIERRLEAAEKQNIGLIDEIKYLKEQLAQMQDDPEIPDMPDFELNEKFYYLDSMTADVEDSCHDGDIDAIDFNMFHTEEYAQEFYKKCNLIAMMLHCKWYLDRDYVPDWKDGVERKFFVFYNNCANEFGVTTRTTSDVGYVAFSTEEKARKCADWLNEHWRDTDEESV